MTDLRDYFTIAHITLYVAIFTFCITAWNVIKTYRHTRKKDFQDKLYNLKVEAYRNIIGACADAVEKLDPAGDALEQRQEYSSGERWKEFYQEELDLIDLACNSIQDALYKEVIIIPVECSNATFNFYVACTRYLTMAHELNYLLILEKHPVLKQQYHDLVELFRNELGIPGINKELNARIGHGAKPKKG